MGYPAERMGLFFSEWRMQDAATLASYGVHSGANVSILIPLRAC